MEFINGKIYKTAEEIETETLEWHPHPKFNGIFLKHLATSKDTDGSLSCHIVKLLKGSVMERHLHQNETEIHQVISGEGLFYLEDKEYIYEKGVVSVIKKGVYHSITATTDLYLFANFSPALV